MVANFLSNLADSGLFIYWPFTSLFMALYWTRRSEEHTSELQSLMRISYAFFCLKKKNSYTPLYPVHSKEYSISTNAAAYSVKLKGTRASMTLAASNDVCK